MTGLTFSNYLIIFLSSAFIAGIITPFATWFSVRIHLIDVPGSLPHHIHNKATPMSGGLILTLAFAIGATLFHLWRIADVPTIFAAAAIVFGFGLWDDLKDLRVSRKFLGQVIAASILIIGGIRVQFLESPQIAGAHPLAIFIVLDVLITYFWLVGITNAFNLIDSMDGIAIGLSVTAFGSYTIGSLLSGQTDLTQVCILLLGIAAILFAMNSVPAKIFLGDSGAQTLGFVIAAISIVYSPAGFNQISSWFFPILVVSVPIFDTFLVIYSRLRAGEPIFYAGLDHVYHQLTKIGLSLRTAVILINAVGLLLASIAFIAINQEPLVASLIFGVCLIVGVIGIILLASNSFIEKLNLKLKGTFAKDEDHEVN